MPLSTIDTASISALGYGFKNRLINGGMQIDQRNAGASVNTNLAFPVDRFTMGNSSDGVATAQQSSTAPGGFPNSVVLTTTTADASLSATQYLGFAQQVEGLNVADLGWGTASAATVTLSFWTRSSLTGTFSGSLRNSAGDRSYVFTYTISAANTWEQKSITISGDTSGTWLTTNGIGIRLWFSLGTGSTYTTGTSGSWAAANYLSVTGSTSVIGTLSANWYITGVQLEKGTVATSFDWRPYGTELALCQRYFCKSYSQGSVPGTSSTASCSAWVVDTSSLNRVFFTLGSQFPVTMRAYPSTVTYYSEDGTVNNVSAYNNTATKLVISSTPTPSDRAMTEYLQLSSNATAGMSYVFNFTASAEL